MALLSIELYCNPHLVWAIISPNLSIEIDMYQIALEYIEKVQFCI